MPNSRRTHPKGPGEKKTARQVLEDLDAYLKSERSSYAFDAAHMSGNNPAYDALQARIKGQLATIRIVRTWIKDQKKHLEEDV